MRALMVVAVLFASGCRESEVVKSGHAAPWERISDGFYLVRDEKRGVSCYALARWGANSAVGGLHCIPDSQLAPKAVQP